MAARGHQGFGRQEIKRVTWDQRIQRAHELAQRHLYAAEILTFYAKLAGFQKSLYERWALRLEASTVAAKDLPLEVEILLPDYEAFLDFVADNAPAPLAHVSAGLKQSSQQHWAELLAQRWTGEGSIDAAEERFLAFAYLQPYAELLAVHVTFSPEPGGPVCPICGAYPVCGVLRPEAYGGRRSLVCVRCSVEWDFPRVVCPACNEQRAEALPVFSADEFEHVRIEACDTCKHYITAIDLTRNGHAVPVVDELASVTLNLWAREKGYRKLQPNLFGL